MSPDECAWQEREADNYEYINGDWIEYEDRRHELRAAEDRAEELWEEIDNISIPRHLRRKWFKCSVHMSKSPERVARWRRSRQGVAATKALHGARDRVDSVWQPDNGYYAYYGGHPKPFDTVTEVVPEHLPEAEAAVTEAMEAISEATAAYLKAVSLLLDLISALGVAGIDVDHPDVWIERVDSGPPGHRITASPHLTNAPPRQFAAPLSVGELALAA